MHTPIGKEYDTSELARHIARITQRPQGAGGWRSHRSVRGRAHEGRGGEGGVVWVWVCGWGAGRGEERGEVRRRGGRGRGGEGRGQS